jgi:GT2 family glycosyltransferase
VAYIDDDARVAEHWGIRALDVIKREMFDAWGGVFLPWYKFGRPHWFRDEYASNAGIDRLQTLTENRFFSGGNCIFRRSILEETGGFPTELGMKGSVRAYGEETQVQLRMRRAGCTLGFDPDLVVYHLVSPAKMQVATLLRDRFAAGRDSWRAFERSPTPVRKLATAAAAISTTSLHLPRALWRLRDPDYYVQNVVVDVAGPAAYALGQLVNR